MKNFTIYLTLSLLCGCVFSVSDYEDDSEISPYIMEDLINSTIEGLRPSIPEPLEIDQLDINFGDFIGESLISGNLQLSDVSVSGLKGFQVTFLNMAAVGMKLNFTIEFPTIDLSTGYLADTVLLTILPIYGNGTSKIQIEGLQLMGSSQLNLTSGMQFKNFKVAIGLERMSFEVNGLLYDDEFSSFASTLVTSLLNDVVIPFLNENAGIVSTVISPIIEGLINDVLAGMTATTTTVSPDITAAVF
jgi:hypothetical protein